jgi:hypothetical protein
MNFQKSIFLCLCLLVASIVSAEKTDPIIVKSTAEGTELSLLLANLEGVRTYVELISLDSKETVWKQNVAAHNGFSYNLDLAKLDYGRYRLKITKGAVTKNQVIAVGEFGVMLSEMK